MNFSYEEIYYHFGQYDTFVMLSFDRRSDEFKRFGNEFLMGNFIYTIEERKELERRIKEESHLRTDKKVKFSPSKLLNLDEEDLTLLDRDGIQVSSITSVLSYNNCEENKFLKKGKKEINRIDIKAPRFSNWEELNKCSFSFLNELYKEGNLMTPKQEKEYWAFRKYYGIGLEEEDFKDFFEKQNSEVLDDVRFIELEIKYKELKISEDEKKEYAKLFHNKLDKKKKIINLEITKSHEKVSEIAKKYSDQLIEFMTACLCFDEKIIAFGRIPIYLDFERFVHIFARHVAETQIGDRFKDDKTVFQYKYNDILSVLELVIEKQKDDIQSFFKENKEKPYRRMGTRACYMNGNYYHLEINSNGSIKDFYPMNNPNVN